MTTIISDRVFWIYFIVTLFFIIIGMGSIFVSNDPYMIVISILWLLSNVALMILVYHASINLGPHEQVCVVDVDSGCFDSNNRMWLFINILFIALLIISTLWAGELGHNDAGPLKTASGILILLGGLILCGLATEYSLFWSAFISFWIAIGYIIIWFGLTLYVIITN